MRFLIADTFTSSLGKLTNEEQSFVKNTAFDLQLNPAHPGLQFHRLERTKDKNFWSVRSGRDLRIIVHKTAADFLLCYVDHHNAAYSWAERRKLETHPETGAAQFVEIRETVKFVPRYVEEPVQRRVTRPFADLSDSDLLKYGVPLEWLTEVRDATEDSLLDLCAHIPSEAGEALLELATGSKPLTVSETYAGELVCVAEKPADYRHDPFSHPDAKRRFTLISSSDELSRALEYPWDKWTVFLHPEQRSFVEKTFNGPARVSGSAGTGKTIVALHRAYNLALKHPDARVLLATFSDSLAEALRANLHKLMVNQPHLAERIDVVALPSLIRRLFEAHFGRASFATETEIRNLIAEAKAQTAADKFTTYFLWKEWEQIVDAWQIRTWEQYRVVPRLGRKTRLNEENRKVLWSLFEKVRDSLASSGLVTQPEASERLQSRFGGLNNFPYSYAVIDEAQDISVPQLRLLASVLATQPNGLFFAGDLGQRIFQQPFSWTALGVDIRGRSKTLKINYRTSQEIRRQADRLLDAHFSDVDGISEDRSGTVSVFSGPPPIVIRSSSIAEESRKIGKWLRELIANGVRAQEICIIVRSESEIGRALDAARSSGCATKRLNTGGPGSPEAVTLATMHLAKGLEYRAVVVMACDDEILPLQARIESVGDDADLQEVYATERQLLYVACTRARDYLLVSGVNPAAEFLDDFEAE